MPCNTDNMSFSKEPGDTRTHTMKNVDFDPPVEESLEDQYWKLLRLRTNGRHSVPPSPSG